MKCIDCGKWMPPRSQWGTSPTTTIHTGETEFTYVVSVDEIDIHALRQTYPNARVIGTGQTSIRPKCG